MPDNKLSFETFLEYVKTQGSGAKEPISREEKSKRVKELVTSAEARKAFAETRAGLILPILDRNGTARKVLQPVDVADGAQIVFDISFEEIECAWVSPSVSSYPTRFLEADELYVPVFVIKAGVEFGRDMAKDGRFDVASEATRLLGNRVIFNEDLSAWNLVTNVVADASFPAANSIEIGTAGNGTVTTSTGEGFFSKDLINDMLTQSEVQRYAIDNIFVTPKGYGDIRDWMPDNIAQSTQEKIFNAAGLDSVYGVAINKMDSTEFFSDRRAYGVRTDTFGKFAQKESLETFENPLSMMTDKIGVLGRERIGLAAIQAKGLISATIDRP